MWLNRFSLLMLFFYLCKQRNQQHIANIYLLGFQGASCPSSFINFKRCSMCEHFLFVQYKTITKSSRISLNFFVDFQNFTKSKFVGDKYSKFWAFINLSWGKERSIWNFLKQQIDKKQCNTFIFPKELSFCHKLEIFLSLYLWNQMLHTLDISNYEFC